jgi:hypothetical protein
VLTSTYAKDFKKVSSGSVRRALGHAPMTWIKTGRRMLGEA